MNGQREIARDLVTHETFGGLLATASLSQQKIGYP